MDTNTQQTPPEGPLAAFADRFTSDKARKVFGEMHAEDLAKTPSHLIGPMLDHYQQQAEFAPLFKPAENPVDRINRDAIAAWEARQAGGTLGTLRGVKL